MAYHTGLNTTFLVKIALLYVAITGSNFSQISGPNFTNLFCAVIVIMVIAPLLYLVYTALRWTLSQRSFAKALFKRFQARNEG